MPVRDIEPDTHRPAMEFSVTYPGSPPSGGPASLRRWTGRWRHVTYRKHPPVAWRGVDFRGGVVGIYTTGIAACYCVALIAGRTIKYTGNYSAGALAHLPGGDPSNMPWAEFIAATGFSAQQIVDMSGLNSFSAHLLIAGNDAGSHFMADLILANFRERCNIANQAVTYYLGGVQQGFGVHTKGWFGVPTFGGGSGVCPIPADDW